MTSFHNTRKNGKQRFQTERCFHGSMPSLSSSKNIYGNPLSAILLITVSTRPVASTLSDSMCSLKWDKLIKNQQRNIHLTKGPAKRRNAPMIRLGGCMRMLQVKLNLLSMSDLFFSFFVCFNKEGLWQTLKNKNKRYLKVLNDLSMNRSSFLNL